MSLWGVEGVEDLLDCWRRGGSLHTLLAQVYTVQECKSAREGAREGAGEGTGEDACLQAPGRTYGRKLQAELGRLATRVKISEIRRCCTLVSSCV